MKSKRLRIADCRLRIGRRANYALRIPHYVGSYALLLFCLMIAVLWPTLVKAHDPSLHPAQVLGALGFDQRLEEQAPLDLVFLDEAGQRVALQEYFDDKPVILALGYFTCPNLCPLVRNGLADSLRQITFDAGQEFEVVMVSIDPQETPVTATEVKAQELAAYNRPGTETGWHFLTGDHATIDRLAEAVGFRYAYDTRQKQYAHASGIVILTPAGQIARYLFGLDYSPRDLRLALVEAAANQIGSPLDQVLLFCYHYDPITGQYTMLIMNVLRLAGLATVMGLGGLVVVMLRREKRLEIGY